MQIQNLKSNTHNLKCESKTKKGQKKDDFFPNPDKRVSKKTSGYHQDPFIFQNFKQK